MANSFYNYTAPVVAGTTIRADKYNSDQQSIDSAFESTELELDKRLRLPDTFTGNAVIPEVTAADSFLYIDTNQNITLYPAATFQEQFDSVESKFDQINTWQGEVSDNKVLVEGYVGDALEHANTASNHAGTATDRKGEAEAARDLAQEWASNPPNVYITGTTKLSAEHWAIKAQEYAQQTLDAANGDFVPQARTINSKALSADIVLQAADVFAVPTTRTINSKALSANITLNATDVGAAPTTRTINGYDLSADRVLNAADVGAVAIGQYGIGVTDLPDLVVDANTLDISGSVQYLGGGSANLPASDGFVHVVGNNANNNQTQLFFKQADNRMFLRSSGAGVFKAWDEVYHTGNKPTSYDVGAVNSALLFNHNLDANAETTDDRGIQSYHLIGAGTPDGNGTQFSQAYNENYKTHLYHSWNNRIFARTQANNGTNNQEWVEVATQKTYNNAGTQSLTRQAVNTYINRWSSGDVTYELNATSFSVGDKVYITRFYETAGVITMTTTVGGIFLPDGTSSASHTLSAVGTVCLERVDTTNFILRKA